MKSKSSPYESRCPRCDVSFPVETRKCLHCGGKTLRGAESAAVEAIVGSAYESFGKTTAESSGVQESSPFPESEEQSGDSLFRLPEFRSDDREIEMAEEPKSIGKSLIQGLGGFVWIIVLIGFTLVRNCGGE